MTLKYYKVGPLHSFLIYKKFQSQLSKQSTIKVFHIKTKSILCYFFTPTLHGRDTTEHESPNEFKRNCLIINSYT